ncbi:MAG: hypothetical protein WBJ03_07365 [Moraxellaceae bacterium]
MDKRQGALAALLGLVVVAGLAIWWMTREPEAPADITPGKAATVPMTATVSAPLASTPAAAPAAPPSDEVALSEEVIDQIRKEGEELNSRAADLEAQVNDGEALIAMKEKQIRELEAQLKAQENTKPAKP